MESDSHSDSQIKEFYRLKNIAVVGVSKNQEKPSAGERIRMSKSSVPHVKNTIVKIV